LDEGSFDEFGDSGAFVLGFAGLLGAFSGFLVLDVDDGQAEDFEPS